MDTPPTPLARPDRRRDDRYTAEDALTAMGQMIDVSASGLAVLATQQPPLTPGDRFRIEIRHEDRIVLLPAELVYADRTAAAQLVEPDEPGVKLGLKFGKLTPAQQREVQAIIDRGVLIPHLDVAWDMSSIDGADEPDQDEDDIPTVSFGALDDQAPLDGIDALGELPQQANSLAQFALTGRETPTQETLSTANETVSKSAAPPPEVAPQAEPSVNDDIEETNQDQEQQSHQAARMIRGGTAPVREAQPGEVNQRRAGRVVAEDATTSLGKIVDMSAGGMCIQRKGAAPVRVGSEFMIDLHIAGRVLRAPVEVMRIQKIGWRTFEYGLKFGEWPDDVRSEFGRLVRMATCGRQFG